MEQKQSGILFRRGRSLLAKGAVIGLITFVLLIPTIWLLNLVNERQLRKQSVIHEISTSWGGRQTITGPILCIPYYENEQTVTMENGRKKSFKTRQLQNAYFLPEKLHITGEVFPEKRKRGIFEVAVYQSGLRIHGAFKSPDIAALGIASEDVLWDKATLIFGLSDLRGLQNEIEIKAGDFQSGFKPIVFRKELIGGALTSRPFTLSAAKGIPDFDLAVTFRGSENLSVLPLGNTTTLHLSSPWKDPGFFGAFLPDKSVINDKGFSADWKTFHLNRNFQSQFKEHELPAWTESAFGVNLLTPTDNYHKTERSVKYAILIISMTFLAFFFSELLNGERIHPFQYGLIGLALCVFYTLLLSVSEFTGFNIAYSIASALTLGMIFLYSSGVFKNRKLPFLTTGVTALLYSFIYFIIQLEDTALLIGSIGLFLILGVTMYFSGKINWYATESAEGE